jgi:hypothetical protein
MKWEVILYRGEEKSCYRANMKAWLEIKQEGGFPDAL